ncbi:MAG: terpene cyclase/mutase family protein [bacterium]|nr:terpene cyclase/mutase family protein [bacterium]
MMHRLRALSFVLALGSLVATVAAQVPGGGNVAVSGRFVYALHDGVLYKVDSRNMRIVGHVKLRVDDRRRGVAGRVRPARRKVAVEAPPETGVEIVEVQEMEPEEVVEVEEVVEEIIDVEEAKKSPSSVFVDRALEWLVAHQDIDGKWDADGFMKHDTEGAVTDGPGNPTKDVGVTGLATLALLGSGSTMRRGPHKRSVMLAVKWLRSQQHNNGLIGSNAAHDFIYSHCIATFALSEAYGLSRYKLLRPTVQKAINYLESHRNPYSVWRYQPRDNDNDTSVTTWALMAYASGQSFGLDVNGNAMQLVGAWYDQITDVNGRAGYTRRGEASARKPGDHMTRFPPKNGEAMTAAALVGRFLLDQSPKQHPVMLKSAGLIGAKAPRWQDGHIDPYYWWFGTQAMYRIGGRHWQNWAKALKQVGKAQRRDDNFTGSWDPVGVWDMDGGRVYSTAMYALALQVHARAMQLVR